MVPPRDTVVARTGVASTVVASTVVASTVVASMGASQAVREIEATGTGRGDKVGKGGPAHHVCTGRRLLAVPDGDDARQVGGNLHAATVVLARGGLVPDGFR